MLATLVKTNTAYASVSEHISLNVIPSGFFFYSTDEVIVACILN